MTSPIETLFQEAAGIEHLAQNFQHKEFNLAADLILQTESKLLILGLGKTGHIGKKLAATFSSTGTSSFFIHAAEANHGDLGAIDFKKDTLIIITHSGESAEAFNTARIANERGMRIITMCNNDDSTIAKLSNVNLKNFVNVEACPHNLAPTTSTTVTLALGDALAIEVMMRKNFTAEDFSKSHPGGKLYNRFLKASSTTTMQNLPAIPLNSTFKEALSYLNQYRLGCLVVLNDDGSLAGFLSSGDFTRGLENVGLDGYIKDCMIKSPQTINHDDLAIGGFNRMTESNISSLIVMKDDMPIGLLDIKVCQGLF